MDVERGGAGVGAVLLPVLMRGVMTGGDGGWQAGWCRCVEEPCYREGGDGSCRCH
jgi:hypothetical protein